eukprot:g80174.t1
MARFLDSARNPYAQGVFDPRAADVCLGHFLAPLDVERGDSPEEAQNRLKKSWARFCCIANLKQAVKVEVRLTLPCSCYFVTYKGNV